MKLKVPGEKLKKAQTVGQRPSEPRESVSERNVSLGREDDCHVARNPTSTTVLQVPTERPLQSTGQGSSVIRGPVPTITRGQGRAPMVNQLPGAMERQSLLTHEPEVVIESDASLTGWGVACQEARTGGPWSPEETQFHINCLEILAAFLAIRTIMHEGHLLIDNTTAVAYINHQGGTVSPMATDCQGRMDVVPREGHHNKSPISTRSGECEGRQRVQSDAGPLRLDAELSDLSGDTGPVGQSPSNAPERAGGNSANDRTSVANTALVPEPVRPVDRLPKVDSSGGRGEHSLGNSSVTSSSSSATASRVAYLKQRYSSESLPYSICP